MAWILLNIHRATEAMGRAAVFYCVLALPQTARSILYSETLLAQSRNVRKTIKKKGQGFEG